MVALWKYSTNNNDDADDDENDEDDGDDDEDHNNNNSNSVNWQLISRTVLLAPGSQQNKNMRERSHLKTFPSF